jgi:hypothetical protein
MDFIEGLPQSNKYNSILTVVDRLTKYAHFVPLSHPYTTSDIADLFVKHIYKLHGSPSIIISDRDRIFTSNLWKTLFSQLGAELHFTTLTTHNPTDK